MAKAYAWIAALVLLLSCLEADSIDLDPTRPPTLHPMLLVSTFRCKPDEVAHCEGMVRISCNAAVDAPVHYYDNASAKLLGTCGAWVNDPHCMPQRWKVCAVKNGVRHIAEEPDPSR